MIYPNSWLPVVYFITFGRLVEIALTNIGCKMLLIIIQLVEVHIAVVQFVTEAKT